MSSPQHHTSPRGAGTPTSVYPESKQVNKRKRSTSRELVFNIPTSDEAWFPLAVDRISMIENLDRFTNMIQAGTRSLPSPNYSQNTEIRVRSATTYYFSAHGERSKPKTSSPVYHVTKTTWIL